MKVEVQAIQESSTEARKESSDRLEGLEYQFSIVCSQCWLNEELAHVQFDKFVIFVFLRNTQKLLGTKR